MKILNLYAGIGGNRKLWGNDHDITAVEWDEETAKVYQDYFPNDEVIIADAHQYLLQNYMGYDFIWTSTPCPTHSDTNYAASARGKRRKARYPDMKLYQEIILLRKWFDGKWVSENVKPYYEYLIEPTKVIGRHPFWCNFKLGSLDINYKTTIAESSYKDYEREYGYDLSNYSFDNYERRKRLRNCVHPKIGKHILDRAQNIIRKSDTEQTALEL